MVPVLAFSLTVLPGPPAKCTCQLTLENHQIVNLEFEEAAEFAALASLLAVDGRLLYDVRAKTVIKARP